jgi:two-component system chemotaxis response regulator CheB
MTATQLIIIGASAGGLRAIETILARLPADLAVPLLVVLHRAEGQEGILAELLDRAGPLSAREVHDKAPFTPGVVFIAPAGYHVLVEPGHFALSTDGSVGHSRPSIDVALESAADALGTGAIGVVLTGANEDGAAGLKRLRRRGGIAIVQDPATSEVATMPAAARAAAEPQVIAELPAIATLLGRLGGARA